MMEGSSVPLIDVNTSTASVTWPLLLNSISSADYVAIDLELSGIGAGESQACVKARMEDHYQFLNTVVTSRAILSLGLACFKWSELDGCTSSAVPLHAEVYNVWLLIQQPFLTDPSSAKFLIKHGFDFNKQYSLGLPYLPPAARTKSTPSPQYLLDTILACLMQHAVPVVFHNGWLDILFLYHSFYGPLPPSSAACMADLTEIFPGGVYDTKAIAQFQCFEDANFLEYVFRICQRRNATACANNQPHLMLQYSSETADKDYVEHVEMNIPPALPPEQLHLISVCASFGAYGHCNKHGCEYSHDVLVAVDQRVSNIRKEKRKRKRRTKKQWLQHNEDMEKRQKFSENQTPDLSTRSPDESCDSHVTGAPDADTDQSHDPEHTDISQLFQSDLAHARAKLVQRSNVHSSLGHRAGLDAFMTGYAFACYALHSSTSGEKGEDDIGRLAGLSEMRNCLPSRARTWKVPLHILKSQYTNTSATHSIAQHRMRELVTRLQSQGQT